MFLCPVTGDMLPYLNCSGGDYISHHNRKEFVGHSIGYCFTGLVACCDVFVLVFV